MNDRISPVALFLSAFTLSSLGGLTALLRSHKVLSVRLVISAILYSGLMGLVIALLSHKYFGVDNPYFLLGVCGLAGIGGTTVLDFVIQTIRNGGLNIKIVTRESPDTDAE